MRPPAELWFLRNGILRTAFLCMPLIAQCWLHPMYQDLTGSNDGNADSARATLALLAVLASNGGTSVSYKLIYVTSMTYQGGAINSDTGADLICANDPGKPLNGGTYQAILGVKDVRHWCRTDQGTCPGGASLGWPLKASTEYRQSDGITVIGTTDSDARFSFPLANPFSLYPDTSWTGLASDWSSSNVTSECGNWTGFGCCGNHFTNSNTTAINEGNRNCSLYSRLICAEQ